MAKEKQEAFETFNFDLPPIRGFPELRWAGKRPFRSTQYFPAQKKESYGDATDGWWNRLYWGDNLQVMSHLLREFRGKVDLIYIDPPFDSKAEYTKSIVVEGKEASSLRSSFEEKQYSDIWRSDQYLQFMYERITLMKELLAETGTLALHCDYHQSHFLRCILDELFGSDRFVNEIKWKRATTVKGNSGQGSLQLGENVDNILIYSKSSDYTFNIQYTPYTQKYIDDFYKYKEPNGRIYRLISMTAPGGDSKGNPQYEVLGVKRFWRYSRERMQQLIDSGMVVQTSPGAVPQKKLYLDEGKGVAIQTLWDDIDGIAAVSSERVGYPTQKPEALMERIISLLSNANDLVLDCFTGSGTTPVTAMKLGRRFVAADINLGSIETTTRRLNAGRIAAKPVSGQAKVAPPGFVVFNVNDYDLFRNPVEARELIRDAMELQPLSDGSSFDGQRDDYLVKIMPVNRVATRSDLNEVIQSFDFKAFERRRAASPNKPVERVHLVCMGHEPDLAAELEKAAKPFDIEVMITDLIRDKSHLHFKRASDARIKIENGELVVVGFYPMNLLQKLSMDADQIEDWRRLVECVKVDWNYDGVVLTPTVVDAAEKNQLVVGRYKVPADAATIRVKITDLLSESWEGEITNG